MLRLIAAVGILLAVLADSMDGVETEPGPDVDNGFCQRQCPCLGNVIDCSKKNLKTLAYIPRWVENLELSSNRLSHDTLSAQLTGLNKLQVLNLNHNRLQRLPIFQGLGTLSRLHVAHNEIESIELDALKALPALRFLDLSRNAIKEVLYLSFPAKNSLQYLNLNFNKITTLTKGTFQRLPFLKRLEISGNGLEDVQSLTFQNLNQLKSLKLNNNRIPALMDGVFHGLTTIAILELNNNSITSIRKGGFFNLTSLTSLSLARNAISEIEQSGWEFAPKLVSLDLSYNQLVALDRYTFEELSALKALNLQGNRIASIGEGTFNETKSLETLYLSENLISWTIEDMRGPFLGLTKLEQLYLNSNEIKSVSRNAFLGLKSLTLLELSQNNISSIQSNAFKDTVRLKSLIMNSTNLLCDCNLLWFYQWIQDRKDVFQIDAECIYPIWLRNRLIRDLHASNFSCYDSPKPHLIDEPKSQLGIRGTNLTLTCIATSTAPDVMTFKWKHDNQELPSTHYTVEQLNNENGTIGTTELTIPSIQQSDAGKYQCIITNDFGVVYSQRGKVTVGTYPKFRKTPSDVSVQSGKTARLSCSAVGDPKPQIAWEKDGGNDFPAARERRMRVIPNEDAFLIINAQLVDMGVYSCTAENPAGIIRANASVIVYESLTLLRPMATLETVVGKSSVLDCMVSGFPKPFVQWLKDGELIEASERHFFTAEGQLLIIVGTLMTDAGLYECRLENEFGSESGLTRLAVIEEAEDMHETYGVDGSFGSTGTGDGNGMTNEQIYSYGMIVVVTVICCAILVLLSCFAVYFMQKRLRGSSSSHLDEGDIGLTTGLEINQPNLIVRPGVGISTTPADYFEYLIPMGRNGEITTNVDDDGELPDGGEGRPRSIGGPRGHGLGDCYYTVVPKVPLKARRTDLDSDDIDDDLSSKDSGTGGDCASATGSTNAAHQRGSHEDLKCLLHSLNRKHTEMMDDGSYPSYNENDPDSDPRIEPPPPIPPVNATTAVLGGTSKPPRVPYDDMPPAAIVARLPSSQTFPTFVHPPNPASSLLASSLEATQELVPMKQIQVNQLYQLLLENPRLMDKPVKYRSKSVEQDALLQHLPPSSDDSDDTQAISSSGIGTDSCNSITANGTVDSGVSLKGREVAVSYGERESVR